MTRQAIFTIFGDPIPGALEDLADAVNSALEDAERSTEKNTEFQRRIQCQAGELTRQERLLADATYLKPRNHGGHFYPYLGYGPSGCDYCECCVGGFSNSAPKGVDQNGDCPGNPKLREAYDLLKKQAKAAADNWRRNNELREVK